MPSDEYPTPFPMWKFWPRVTLVGNWWKRGHSWSVRSRKWIKDFWLLTLSTPSCFGDLSCRDVCLLLNIMQLSCSKNHDSVIKTSSWTVLWATCFVSTELHLLKVSPCSGKCPSSPEERLTRMTAWGEVSWRSFCMAFQGSLKEADT